MCKRNTTDPLVRAFLDTYRINLLSLPRANANVGELYVQTFGGISSSGRLSAVLTPEFELPPLQTNERLANLAGLMSREVSLKVGLGLLDAFLTALGAGLLIQRVCVSYESKGAQTLRFRLTDATRDSMDPLEFGARLIGHRLNERHPFIEEGNRFFVTTGVIRTPSLTLLAENEEARAVELDVDALRMLQANTQVELKRTSQGEISYSGETPLAIGVELHELEYDRNREKFRLRSADEAVPIRATGSQMDERVFLGDETAGEAFITLS